jgi:hypothetical protein
MGTQSLAKLIVEFWRAGDRTECSFQTTFQGLCTSYGVPADQWPIVRKLAEERIGEWEWSNACRS